MLNGFWEKTITLVTMIRQSRGREMALSDQCKDRIAFIQPQVGRSMVNTLSTSTKSK